MAYYLGSTIIEYFKPREPLPYIPPNQSKTHPPCTSITSILPSLNQNLPKSIIQTTPEQRHAKQKAHQEKRHAKRIERERALYNPKEDATARSEHYTADAYKTLFVSRLNYSLTAEDIQKEFEYYGPIVNVRLIHSKVTGKSRGYAFVEFLHSKDMTEAFKDAAGKKLVGRRIVVDVERGRTVKNWYPKRLGGGLGTARTPRIQTKT
jgi:U1 small nuclear ribonucleoprotein